MTIFTTIILKIIKSEHENKGMQGRFGAGLPRINDGSS